MQFEVPCISKVSYYALLISDKDDTSCPRRGNDDMDDSTPDNGR